MSYPCCKLAELVYYVFFSIKPAIVYLDNY